MQLQLFLILITSLGVKVAEASETGDLMDETSPNETVYECLGPSREDMELYSQLAWWMDGVIQVKLLIHVKISKLSLLSL